MLLLRNLLGLFTTLRVKSKAFCHQPLPIFLLISYPVSLAQASSPVLESPDFIPSSRTLPGELLLWTSTQLAPHFTHFPAQMLTPKTALLDHFIQSIFFLSLPPTSVSTWYRAHFTATILASIICYSAFLGLFLSLEPQCLEGRPLFACLAHLCLLSTWGWVQHTHMC